MAWSPKVCAMQRFLVNDFHRLTSCVDRDAVIQNSAGQRLTLTPLANTGPAFLNEIILFVGIIEDDIPSVPVSAVSYRNGRRIRLPHNIFFGPAVNIGSISVYS